MLFMDLGCIEFNENKGPPLDWYAPCYCAGCKFIRSRIKQFLLVVGLFIHLSRLCTMRMMQISWDRCTMNLKKSYN